MEAFKKSKKIPRPPTVEDIDKMAGEKLPEELERFLNLVFTRNEPVTENCERTKRFIFSIGQDVCRAVSQGRWKLAKHEALVMPRFCWRHN